MTHLTVLPDRLWTAQRPGLPMCTDESAPADGI